MPSRPLRPVLAAVLALAAGAGLERGRAGSEFLGAGFEIFRLAAAALEGLAEAGIGH